MPGANVRGGARGLGGCSEPICPTGSAGSGKPLLGLHLERWPHAASSDLGVVERAARQAWWDPSTMGLAAAHPLPPPVTLKTQLMVVCGGGGVGGGDRPKQPHLVGSPVQESLQAPWPF